MLVKKGVSTRGLRALTGHSFLPPWITMIHGGELPKQQKNPFFYLLFSGNPCGGLHHRFRRPRVFPTDLGPHPGCVLARMRFCLLVRMEPKVHGCYYLSGDIQMGNATVAKSVLVSLPSCLPSLRPFSVFV